VKGKDAQLLVLAAEMDKAGDRQSKEKRGAGRGEGRRGEEGRGGVRRAVKEVGKRVDKVKRGSAASTKGYWPCWRRQKASTKASPTPADYGPCLCAEQAWKPKGPKPLRSIESPADPGGAM